MRKAKNRCADCTKWQAGDEWHSTFNPNFAVEAAGICSGTGRTKLNVERACPHFENANRGKIFYFKG